MTAAKEGSPMVSLLDSTLLCIVLGLIALRCMVIEVPLVDQFQTRLMLSSEVVSLLTSTALLVCVGVWLSAAISRGRFCWRKTGFGAAVGVFIVAGVLSAIFASDKRAAVTDMVTLATPMLTGLLLVQLFTSAVRIRLALLLILAVGAATTLQCVDQWAESNETLIAEYESDPVAFLEKQGIVPDSMEHWMYEHRLYSKDIRGFLMTSNSTATFLLFAVFSGIGLCLQAVGKKMTQEAIAAFVCYLLALGIVLFGLFLTRSKGGIAAFVLGGGLLFLLSAFGRFVWKYRLVLGTLVLLLVVAVGGAVVHYGLQHGRLPGGNSMLVRWQYWGSAAEMIRDHAATGVGGGNFPTFYTHYKVPAASETVQNPHNWILSLLSQYGPLGLVAFLAAFLGPLYKAWRRCCGVDSLSGDASPSRRGKLWVGLLVSMPIMLLLIRPLLVDAEFLYQQVEVRSAAYLFLYLIPAGVVVVSFALLCAASSGDVLMNGRNDRLSIALICGTAAVLVHNLIDFAIFEPGNFGIFWLMIAILAAQLHNGSETRRESSVIEPAKRFGIFAGLALVGVAYLAIVLLPPLRAESLLKQACRDDLRRIELIETAISADTLSSKTAYRAGLIFKQAYQQQRGKKDARFLEKAIAFSDVAAARNAASFKPRRLLGQINVLLAQQAEDGEKYLQAAFDDFQRATERYPGSGRLHYDLATVAEQLNRREIALRHYRLAVEVEDAYRAQFRAMYPERKTVISRLGDTVYENAKNKVSADESR